MGQSGWSERHNVYIFTLAQQGHLQRSVCSRATAEKATEVWLFDFRLRVAIEPQQWSVYAKPTINALWPNGNLAKPCEYAYCTTLARSLPTGHAMDDVRKLASSFHAVRKNTLPGCIIAHRYPQQLDSIAKNTAHFLPH